MGASSPWILRPFGTNGSRSGWRWAIRLLHGGSAFPATMCAWRRPRPSAIAVPSSVRFGFNDWQDVVELPTVPNSLGLHVLHIDTARLTARQRVDFTLSLIHI